MKNDTGALWLEIARLRDEIQSLRGGPVNTVRAWHCGRALIMASGMVIGLAVGLFFFDRTAATAQDEKEPKVLTCQTLKITGPNGKEMVIIGFDDDGGLIRVMTKDQKLGALLAVDENGAGRMRFNAADGKSMLHLGRDDDGGYVRAYTKDGKGGAFFGIADQSQSGLIYLSGPDGKTILSLSKDDDGGYVRANTNDGKKVAFFGAALKSEGGLIMLSDTKGKVRLALFGTDNGGQIDKN